jgi:hypothetical protein
MAKLEYLPEPKFSPRGFQYLLMPKEHGDEALRLVSQSSAVDPQYENNAQPGASYLWIGDSLHLNRQEIAELVSVLQHWLETGYLKDPEQTEWMDGANG